MLIPHQSLIVVADGRRYLLLRNAGTPDRFELAFEGGGEQENPATAEQGSDQPGRSFASHDARRSAMEQTDFHQIAEERFAADICDMLNRLAEADDFAGVVIVAPARTLGELRRNYGKALVARVLREVDKDLTPLPVPEIARVLAELD